MNKAVEENDKRVYGIDILRILSMFGIISLHILNQGGVYNEAMICGGFRGVIVSILLSVSRCSVDIFAIITGYLYVNREKISRRRLANLWITAIFYIILVTVYVYIDRPELFTDATFWVKALIPPVGGKYWYLVCYTVVFLLIPYSNRLIANLSRKEFRTLLIILILLLSVLPTIGMTDFFVEKTDIVRGGCLYVIL